MPGIDSSTIHILMYLIQVLLNEHVLRKEVHGVHFFSISQPKNHVGVVVGNRS